MFEKDDFVFKIDLKSGYHHLDIVEKHQKDLCFAWKVDGVTQYLYSQFCFAFWIGYWMLCLH